MSDNIANDETQKRLDRLARAAGQFFGLPGGTPYQYPGEYVKDAMARGTSKMSMVCYINKHWQISLKDAKDIVNSFKEDTNDQ